MATENILTSSMEGDWEISEGEVGGGGSEMPRF